MKLLLFAILYFSFIGGILGSTSFNWKQLSIKEKNDHCLEFIMANAPVGSIESVNTMGKKVSLSLLRVSIHDGIFEIDTRKFHKAMPTQRVVISLPEFSPGDFQTNRNIRLTAKVQAIPAGRNIVFILNGKTINKGKTSSFSKWNFAPTKQNGLISISDILPEGGQLKALRCVIHLTDGGIYKIGQITVTPEKLKNPLLQADQNLLINGNAERSFYATHAHNIAIVKSTYDGKGRGWDRKEYEDILKADLDSEVVHSGKYSFRLTAPYTTSPVPCDAFYFAPVKYFPGNPFAFSAWMKSAKGPMKVALTLRVTDGQAYNRKFTIDGSWKKYTVTIPRFGYRANKVEGWNVSGMKKNPFNLTYPQITVKGPGVLYVDDAVVQHALSTKEFSPERVLMTGSLDRKTHTWFLEEPISGQITLNSLAETKKVMLKWKLFDFFGKKIAEGEPEEVYLPMNRTFSIQPPKSFRGAGNLIFSATEENGASYDHVFYLGVLPKGGKKVLRLGFNTGQADYENMKVLLEILQDCRIGSVRTWFWCGDGLRELKKLYQPFGFYNVFCIAMPVYGNHNHCLPWNYSDFLKRFIPEVRKMRGVIQAYEILNEPNIRGGMFRKGTDLKKWRKVTVEAVVDAYKAIAPEIRKADPAAKIVGPCTCGTNAAYIASFMNSGGRKYVNVISEHPYRFTPECPDYGEDLRNIRKALGPADARIPIYSTEAAQYVPNMFPDNRITPSIRLGLARDIRLPLVGFANGVSKYFHFNATLKVHAQSTLTPFVLGDSDHEGYPAPGLVLFAFRAFADIVGDAPFMRSVNLGAGIRCSIYNRGKYRVVVLWKWNGPETVLTLPEGFRCYDVMGQKLESNYIPFNQFPVYLKSKLSANMLAAVLRGVVKSQNDEKYTVDTEIKDKESVTINIANKTSQPLSGKVKIQNPQILADSKDIILFSIPAEESDQICLVLKKKVSLVPQSLKYIVKLPKLNQSISKEFQIKALTVPFSQKRIKLDGDLSDWPKDAFVVELDSEKLHSKDEIKDTRTKAEQSMRAEVRMFWTADSLCLAATLFHQNCPLPEPNWNGNSLRIGLDTLKNAPLNANSYQDDDFEYLVAQVGEKALVKRKFASASSHDSLIKKEGIVSDVPTAIHRYSDRTVYEMEFSSRSISPFRLRAGASCRFNINFNLGNGKQRTGWLELAPGLGESLNPSQFVDLMLVN